MPRTQMIQQAYKFALDPTPAQARMLASHAGARRYVYNWTHAAIMEAADARQAEKDAGEEPTVQIPRQMRTPDHPGMGVLWTRFKNTAVGCRCCRRLLSRDPASAGPWADARTGSITCDPEALGRLGAGGEPGLHDPTGVGCGRCWEPLHQTPAGTWAGRDGAAACPEARKPGDGHEPSSEYMAWTEDVFTGTMQAAQRDADVAWQRFLGGRSRRPRFKKRGKVTESFQVHGDGLAIPDTVRVLVNEPRRPGAARSQHAKPRNRGGKHSGATVRQQTAAHITLPKIGPVRVMSDDSLHPAMRRSRRRASPGHKRHMGNRRRSRQLTRHLRNSSAKAARLGPLLGQLREDAGFSLAQAVQLLGAEADSRAVAAARALLAAAQDALVMAGDEGERKNARSRIRYAQKKLQSLEQQDPGEKAARTDRWSEAKLARLEATGITQGLEQASVICAAYQLTGQARDEVAALAAQARMIRASISLGADGIWWCSVGAEVPYAARTAPSKRQAAHGAAGIDLGTARIMTVTGRRPVTSPAHLEKQLAALGAAQRQAARTVPGSARNRKAKAKAGLIHADVARLRAGTLHRATTSLARTHAVLGVEGFNVQQMMRDGSEGISRTARRRRNRSLADAGIGMARGMLRYKGPRYGAAVVTLGPDAITITGPGPEDAREADLPPDAKPNGTCAGCGQARTKPVRSRQVLYRCDACGRVRLRTLNSAENIRRWAVKALTAEPGCATSGPDQSRGGDEPGTAGARTIPCETSSQHPAHRRGETGIPGG